MSERYSNKRARRRSGNGRFRKTTMADIGLGGVCVCGHFLFNFYDGDPNDPFPNPRLFRNRCFTCEPRTEAEQAKLEAEKQAAREQARQFWAQLAPEQPGE